MKLIDLVRGGKRKYGGREYLLEEELSSIEGGGYKYLGNESANTLFGRGASHARNLPNDSSNEMHRFNSNRLYHGA